MKTNLNQAQYLILKMLEYGQAPIPVANINWYKSQRFFYKNMCEELAQSNKKIDVFLFAAISVLFYKKNIEHISPNFSDKQKKVLIMLTANILERKSDSPAIELQSGKQISFVKSFLLSQDRAFQEAYDKIDEISVNRKSVISLTDYHEGIVAVDIEKLDDLLCYIDTSKTFSIPDTSGPILANKYEQF